MPFTLKRVSPRTKQINSMTFDMLEEDFHECYLNWEKGAHIQNAFPNLNSTEREFILTGYTQEDWDAIFPKE
jgi:hypothetical protein